MIQFALLAWLAAPALAPASEPETHKVTLTRTVADACAEAHRIASQGPCLRPEDCGAVRSWQRLFGTPRVERLDPSHAGPARSRWRPAAFNCPTGQVVRR